MPSNCGRGERGSEWIFGTFVGRGGFATDEGFCFCWIRFVATLRGHVAAVYRVSWSSDSRMLVSASKDSTLKVSSRSSIPAELVSDEFPSVAFQSCGISRRSKSEWIFLDIRTKCTVSISWRTRLRVAEGTRRSRCEPWFSPRPLVSFKY